LCGSHAGTAPWLSCPAPWAQLSQAQRKLRQTQETWALRRPGGPVVAGTYHSKAACRFHPTTNSRNLTSNRKKTRLHFT
jgi:hypothetical protein